MKKITYNTLLNINAKKIILIGMPGSGKSFIGKKIADYKNLSYLDTDKLLEQKVNMSCENYICSFGEKAFRQEELKVCKDIADTSNCVISTGGGLITQEAAIDILRQNAITVWLQKPIENLVLKGRPLSPDITSATKLYSIRKPLYEKYADYFICL